MLEIKGRGRDKAQWFPLLLRYEAGEKVADIARVAGVTEDRVYTVFAEIGHMNNSDKRALRLEAWRRRMIEAEVEFLLGDPVKAKKLLDAHAAMLRAAAAAEAFEKTFSDDNSQQGREQAQLSAKEVEALREELRERIDLRLAEGAVESSARTGG